MEEQKHSGLGIASFIASTAVGIGLFVLILIGGVIEASTPGGLDEKSAGAVVIGLFLFAFLGLDLLALGMGIGGLLQKERKKIFAVLGTIFSAAAIVCTLLLWVLGIVAG